MNINIVVVGGNGFVGSSVYSSASKLKNVKCVKLLRGEPLSEKLNVADIVIHCANSPSRFRAKIDPDFDFSESVEKTATILDYMSADSHFHLVSSIGARTQIDHIYGKNRLATEKISIDRGASISRLGYLFSEGHVYGIIRDLILNNNVYVSADSKYCFTSLDFVGDAIVKMAIKRSCVLKEFGSDDVYTALDLKKILHS
jgi:nucleoside-diphosphate-sugar epimerase